MMRTETLHSLTPDILKLLINPLFGKDGVGEILWMISFQKNPPSTPLYQRGVYTADSISLFPVNLTLLMNAYLILQGQTFSSLTGKTSGLPILEFITKGLTHF
jgi:hypothetical protein